MNKYIIFSAALIAVIIPVVFFSSNSGEDNGIREISVNAFRFEYDPDTIYIKKGEAVRIEINNLDMVHGISIPDMDIRGYNSVEFTAEKEGEFDWYCYNPCGEGHGRMRGKIIVE